MPRFLSARIKRVHTSAPPWFAHAEFEEKPGTTIKVEPIFMVILEPSGNDYTVKRRPTIAQKTELPHVGRRILVDAVEMPGKGRREYTATLWGYDPDDSSQGN